MMTGGELEASNAAQLREWAGRLTAAGVRPVLVVGIGHVGTHQGQVHVVLDERAIPAEVIPVLQRLLTDLRRRGRADDDDHDDDHPARPSR